MAKRVAINGFGRIGRLSFRNLLQNSNIEVVAINDLTDNSTLAHLLKYDSAQGSFSGTVSADADHIYVNGKAIPCYSNPDPSSLPWSDLGVDTVLECTGRFLTSEGAQKHLDAGCKKVLLSAPAKSAEIKTIVMGVNDGDLGADDLIVSNASCTTNCLAPVCRIVDENWGFQMGSLTTTHAYTADQRIQDAPHKDLRRARAAAFNIVPTSTGAAKAVGKVYPNVLNKMFAMAIRVPVITGSLIELNVLVDNPVSKEEINEVFKSYAEGQMSGVLQYADDPIVSSDIVGNPHSSIFDSLMTDVMGNMIKIVSWYDNEAGYSARLAQMAGKL